MRCLPWLAVALIALSGCGTIVEAEPRRAKVPDLTGMTVPAAERALAKAGLSAEQGERLEALERNGRQAEFAPRTGARVTSQSIEPGRMIEAGGTVVVATGGRAGEDPSLVDVHWRQIGFERGRVVLRDIVRYGDCIAYDHAQLGPVKGGVRLISVWARDYCATTRPDCERNASAFVLDAGPGWTRRTVGVPRLPTAPNPKLTELQNMVRSGAMLEPDRRTVYVDFDRGACEDVAEASATLAGRVATIRIVLGSESSGGNCTADAIYAAVVVRLPAPAPPGTTFVHAPCGGAGEMRCN